MATADSSIDPRILESAKVEFLQHGYQGASLKAICNRADVTTGALYKRYEGKEALFGAVVEPALQALVALADTVEQRDHVLLRKASLSSIWLNSEVTYRYWMDVFYEYFDGLKLLLCCSEGTQYSGFLHAFVKENTSHVLTFMEAVRQQGIHANEINEQELHILLTAYWTAIMEVIVHDFSKEEAYAYCKTLAGFFNWADYFGF